MISFKINRYEFALLHEKLRNSHCNEKLPILIFLIDYFSIDYLNQRCARLPIADFIGGKSAKSKIHFFEMDRTQLNFWDGSSAIELNSSALIIPCSILQHCCNLRTNRSFRGYRKGLRPFSSRKSPFLVKKRSEKEKSTFREGEAS